MTWGVYMPQDELPQNQTDMAEEIKKLRAQVQYLNKILHINALTQEAEDLEKQIDENYKSISNRTKWIEQRKSYLRELNQETQNLMAIIEYNTKETEKHREKLSALRKYNEEKEKQLAEMRNNSRIIGA